MCRAFRIDLTASDRIAQVTEFLPVAVYFIGDENETDPLLVELTAARISKWRRRDTFVFAQWKQQGS